MLARLFLTYHLFDRQKRSFLLYKIPTIYLKTVFKRFAISFGEYTLLKVCWAT